MESSWQSVPRRSIFFIPKAEEARTVPLGACDSKGDLGEAVIGLAVPGKAGGHHHHPLRLSIPLPDQDCPGGKLGSLLVKAGQTSGHCRSSFLPSRSIQHLLVFAIEIAKAIGLDAIGDKCKQQVTTATLRSRPK